MFKLPEGSGFKVPMLRLPYASAHRSHLCPVDQVPKEKSWHLVCPACWQTVPIADREEVYRLYKTERGSERHVLKCRTVVRHLMEERRAIR